MSLPKPALSHEAFRGMFRQAAGVSKRTTTRACPAGIIRASVIGPPASPQTKTEPHDDSSDSSDSEDDETTTNKTTSGGDALSAPKLTPLGEHMTYSVSDGTLRTYVSHRASILRFGFTLTVNGLMAFMRSTEPAHLAISNKTVLYWISAFKFFYACEPPHRQVSRREEMMLYKCLSARQHRFPDLNRQTGAINKHRTAELITWLNTEGAKDATNSKENLSTAERSLLTDVATCLYGGALRIFQCRTLRADSFRHRNAGPKGADGVQPTELAVKVISKASEKRAGNGESPMEEKQVHPEFAARIEDIIRRRGHNTILFPELDKTLEKKLSDCVAACAVHARWPTGQRFSGTHGFRHGAAQDAFLEGGQHGLELVMKRTGHLSKSAARLYALSDMERMRIAQQSGVKREEAINRAADAAVSEARKRVMSDLSTSERASERRDMRLPATAAPAAPRTDATHEEHVRKILPTLLAALSNFMKPPQPRPMTSVERALAVADGIAAERAIAQKRRPPTTQQPPTVTGGGSWALAQQVADDTAREIREAKAKATTLPLRRQRT